jgi:prepilin peptidase CpaA
MPAWLTLVPIAGFAGLMVAAALEDLRRFVIPNQLIIGLCLLYPLRLLTGLGFAAGAGAAGCALAVFLVGAVLFSRGLVGGGDVKLLAAATLWVGPADTPALLIGTGLAGGLLALFLLSPLGATLAAWRTPEPAPSANAMPYGVAITTAALAVAIPPYFG